MNDSPSETLGWPRVRILNGFYGRGSLAVPLRTPEVLVSKCRRAHRVYTAREA